MDDEIANIAVMSGKNAPEIIEALGLRKQHADDSFVNAHADSRERIGKRPGPRYRYDPLKHTGGKNFEGVDDPSPDDDVPQFTPDEEREGPDNSPRRAIVEHPALRTLDNMQIYHADQRFMYNENAAEADQHGEDPNHLEYWLQRPDKKLDALILPSASGPLAYGKIENGLRRFKDAQPDTKIIQISEFPITKKQPLVDVLLVKPTAKQISDTVRTTIGVPHLPELSDQDRYLRTQESYRLQALSRGHTTSSLPASLKREGDPGYDPLGLRGKDSGGKGRG